MILVRWKYVEIIYIIQINLRFIHEQDCLTIHGPFSLIPL